MGFLGQVSSLGHRLVDSTGAAVAYSVPDIATLKTIAAGDRVHGQEVLVDVGQSRWRFHSTSVVAGDDQLVVTPTAGTGRWLRIPGMIDLAFPITFATADAAVLYAMPVGAKLLIQNLYYLVSTTFAGGSSSTIGVSSTKTGFSSKGDLLSGSVGEAAAALVSTVGTVPGIIGVGLNSVVKLKTAIWLPTDNIRFDQITSAFTSGVAEIHCTGQLLVNNGV